MGILDDAIKEHLELKRQHGAAESELKQLEDEAFGAAERPGSEAPPDPLAEAPTEFMEQPDAEPQAPGVAEATSPAEGEASRPAPRTEIADLQEAPPSTSEEESPAGEHEVPTGPTTDEREAIAEQPTEMYDVEEELAASQAEAPSEEDLLEEGLEEPRLAPVDPLAGLDEGDGEVEVEAADAGAAKEADEDDEDDDFWDEKRLSDELDQALEAPSESGDEEEVLPEPEPEPESVAEAEVQEPPAQPEEAPPEEQARHDDEDVLEETPDFLEEAPEDDQLWFEQKPPKDFDFDD
jgi:hypothetical protein